MSPPMRHSQARSASRTSSPMAAKSVSTSRCTNHELCLSRLAWRAEEQQRAIAGDEARDRDEAGERETMGGAAEQAHRQRPDDLARAEGGRHHTDRERG